ncbi:uncharacterized protein LOC127871582 isoform X2 [Dreissena polymorpha]|nr:uncharacterized protein LOC127871582 isoform X2 [Dreissena polymorpha]
MRSYPSTDLQTRTLGDTLCTAKSSDQQLRATHFNVNNPIEKHTGIELARHQIGNEFKADNSSYEKENCKSNVTASKRSDVKFKYADFSDIQSQQAIGFSDRAHDTRSPSILAMHDTNREINETKAQRGCIVQTGIVNESLQRMSISPGHTLQTTARVFSTPNAETRTQTYLEILHNRYLHTDIEKPNAHAMANIQTSKAHSKICENYQELTFRQARQSISFEYDRKQTDFAFEKEISSMPSNENANMPYWNKQTACMAPMTFHESKSTKAATLHNTKTDINNDKPDRKYFETKLQSPSQDILADGYFVPPEKPIFNNPTKSENNSHATIEYLSATNMASSQEMGSRDTPNKPNVKVKYIATEPTDFEVYTRARNAKGNVVVSEKRSSARRLKTSDFKEVSTEGYTNSNHSTSISFEHVNESETNKSEQIYESKPRIKSTLEGNNRTARLFPENFKVTTVANTSRQMDEIPLNVSTEKVRNISGKDLKVPYPIVSEDSVAVGFTTKSICSSNRDKKHSTDKLEYPARDEEVFRCSTSTTKNISKPLASGTNTTRTESTSDRDLRGDGQVAVSGTRHITPSAAREEINATSASKHKNKVSVTNNSRHSIPDKADTSDSLTSARTIYIYQEKAHKATIITNQRVLSDTSEHSGNTLRKRCEEGNVKHSNQLNDTEAAGKESYRTLPMKNMIKEPFIEHTKYPQNNEIERKGCTDKHFPPDFCVRKLKPEPTKLSIPESHSENKTGESIPISALYYTDTDKTSHRRDTHRGSEIQ